MPTEQHELLWLDEGGQLSLAELLALSHLSEDELRELVEYGALAPLDPAAPTWTFSARCVVSVRSACRLREEFDLDVQALALTLRFLDRIHDLETQLDKVRAQLPARFRH